MLCRLKASLVKKKSFVLCLRETYFQASSSHVVGTLAGENSYPIIPIEDVTQKLDETIQIKIVIPE